MAKSLHVSDADAGVIFASMDDDARSRFLLAAAANIDGLVFATGIANRDAMHADGSVVPFMPDIMSLLPVATVTVFVTKRDDLVKDFFCDVADRTTESLCEVRNNIVVGAPDSKDARVLQPVGAGSMADVFCLTMVFGGDGVWDGGVMPAAAGGASLFSENDCTRVKTAARMSAPDPMATREAQ